MVMTNLNKRSWAKIAPNENMKNDWGNIKRLWNSYRNQQLKNFIRHRNSRLKLKWWTSYRLLIRRELIPTMETIWANTWCTLRDIILTNGKDSFRRNRLKHFSRNIGVIVEHKSAILIRGNVLVLEMKIKFRHLE